MIIAQISDTHIAHDTADRKRRLEDFERTIDDINGLDAPPDVIVHTGDVAHSGHPSEYAAALEILAKAPSPVFVLAGNRDDRKNLRQAFSHQGYLKPDCEFIEYTVDDLPFKLVMLDTVSTNSNKGDFCRVRAQSLKSLTNNKSAKPIIVFAHHPPFEAMECPDPFQFETRESMSRMRDGLAGIDGLAAIFCGHVHRFDKGDVAGTLATAMPSTATTLRKGIYPETMHTRPIYQLHRFDPETGLATETRIV
ncbi:MAG: metallophosphoesterase family protein [Hyphomicrobiales bacterium]